MTWIIVIVLVFWILWLERRTNQTFKTFGRLADEKIAELQSQIETLKSQAEDDRRRSHTESVLTANAIEKIEGFKGWGK